jgi:hypothetical protein
MSTFFMGLIIISSKFVLRQTIILKSIYECTFRQYSYTYICKTGGFIHRWCYCLSRFNSTSFIKAPGFFLPGSSTLQNRDI